MAWCNAEILISADSAIRRDPELRPCPACLLKLTEDLVVDEPIDKALARGYEKVDLA